MDIPRKNQKRKRWIKRGLIAIVGLLVVTATTVGLSRLEPAAPSVDQRTLWLDTVKRGPMLREVRGVGTLMSEDVWVVSAQVSGRVNAICKEPGAQVDPNMVILKLSSPGLEQEWQDIQAQYHAAKAQFKSRKTELQDQLLSRDIEQAQAEANLKDAELDAKVMEQQYQDDLISEIRYLKSQAYLENQKRLLEINQKRWTLYREVTYPAQVADAEASLKQMESRYNLKKNQIESLKVKAGRSGVLASVQKRIELGESITPGTVLARITNPKRLKARLKIPEVQARDVRIGLLAEVDTYNGKIPGKVTRIDPTVMEGNVTVDIALTGELPEGARPDLSVVGTVEIERLDDIIYVGRPVFASGASTVELFKVTEDGKYATRTRVTLGRTSVSTIEVIEGLTVGDQIILSDMSQWDEQDKLRLK